MIKSKTITEHAHGSVHALAVQVVPGEQSLALVDLPVLHGSSPGLVVVAQVEDQEVQVPARHKVEDGVLLCIFRSGQVIPKQNKIK